MLNLQKLLPRHYKIIDLFLSGSMTIKEIAEEVGMSTVAIHNIRNSPTFMHELSMRRKSRNEIVDELSARDIVDSTSRIIEDHTEAAAQKIVDLLDRGDPPIQLKAASELLDRGGYPKSSKVEGTLKAAVVVLDAGDVARIERTRELESN